LETLKCPDRNLSPFLELIFDAQILAGNDMRKELFFLLAAKHDEAMRKWENWKEVPENAALLKK